MVTQVFLMMMATQEAVFVAVGETLSRLATFQAFFVATLLFAGDVAEP